MNCFKSSMSWVSAGLMLAVLAGPALAQAPAPASSTPVTGPLAPAPAPASGPKAMWDFQKEIGLSDAQVTKIKAAITTFQTDRRATGLKLQSINREIRTMVDRRAELAQIRPKVEAFGKLQTDLTMEDFETSYTIRKILTKEQSEKWHQIEMRLRQQQMSQPPRH